MDSKRLSFPDTHAFTFDLQPELAAIHPDIQGVTENRHFCAPASKLLLKRNLPRRQPELGRYPDDLLGDIHGASLCWTIQISHAEPEVLLEKRAS